MSEVAAKTYGVVTYSVQTRMWTIACEPHVAIRLKRHFARLSEGSFGEHQIKDTCEVSRDLEWFIDRYPMRMAKDVAERLAARSAEQREQASLVEQLLARRVAGKPFELAEPAREYQELAARILLAQGSLLLADEVGLGKTLSSICTLTDPRTRPALVVTLTHLPTQWEREVKRFAPSLTTHVIKGTEPYDLSRLGGRGAQLGLPGAFPDVVITSYSKLAKWAETFAGLFRSVIYDEGHELRHAENNGEPTKKYAAAQHISESCAYRMALTATPVFNYGSELYNLAQILRPDALGTFEEFKREWCDTWPPEKAPIKDPRAFGQYLRDCGLMLRRTRSEVGRELPPVTTIPHHIEADPAAIDKVTKSCADLARFILDGAQLVKGDKMKAAGELDWKLRAATGVAKAPYVAEFVRMLVESGEPVVLYGWHHEFYRIVCDKLKDLNPVLYTGQESPVEKERAKNEFVEGRSKVLVMSLRAGAGLDGLQHVCRTVVFGELDWSPAVHHQCAGRVARDGQKDPVVVYFLIADRGSDPVVSDVLLDKKMQQEGIRDPDAEIVETMQADPNRVKKLAASILKMRGESVPQGAAA